MADVWLERETATHVPVPVTRNDEPVSDFEVSLTRWPARPTAWAAATVVDGEAGIAVAALAPGTYQVWVRLNGAVVPAGSVNVR